MASLFAVGLPFTYDGTTNHFATTTGGSATVAAVTSADTVTVDSLSGSGTLTIGATWSCTSLVIQSNTAGVACDGTHGITASGSVNLAIGTLNTNGQTCVWGSFTSTNTSTRTLTMGNSSITINTTGATWNTTTTTGMTITANTATITMNAGAPNFRTGSINYNGTSVILDGTNAGSASFGSDSVGQTPTFANLTYIGPAGKTGSAIAMWSPTVTGTLTLTGNSVTNRLLVWSNALGTQRTFTVNTTVTARNVDFMDISGAGTASWNLAAITGNSGDAGGNTGITFTTPADQYFGTAVNGSYLRSTGVSGDYVSVNNSAALQITGDVDIRIYSALDIWSSASLQSIVGKRSGSSGEYVVRTDGANHLQLYWFEGAASVVATSTATIPYGNGVLGYVRAVRQNNVGGVYNVLFYTSPDGTTWTQLGTTVVGAAAANPTSTTNALIIGDAVASGSQTTTGNIYRVQILNGVNGTVAFDSNFATATAGVASFTESSANAATVTIHGTGGNWSAAHWTSRTPLPQDNVFIPASLTGTLTADMPRLGASVDFTGFAGTAALNSTNNSVFGSVTLSAAMTLTHTLTTTFAGRGTHTFTSNGKTWGNSLNFNSVGGSYTLQDALTTAQTLTLNDGTFNSGDFTITCTTFIAQSGRTQTVNLGTSTVKLTGTSGTVWATSANPAPTYNTSSATVLISVAATATRTIATTNAVSQTIGTVTYTVANSPGILLIQPPSSGGATIGTINVNSTKQLQFFAGRTVNITTWNVNGVNNGYLYLPGVAGNYVSTPDSAALSVTGDIDIVLRVLPNSWTPAAEQEFLGKWITGQQSYLFALTGGTKKLRLYVSSTGADSLSTSSSVTIPFADGTAGWIRATWRASDGRVQFFTAADAVAVPSVWTQLGTDLTVVAGSLFDSTAILEVGSWGAGVNSPLAGRVYRAQIYNGIAGTLVFDADFTSKAFGANSFTESSANAATVTINGVLAQAGDGRVTVTSSTGGVAATLAFASRAVSDYITVQDNTATTTTPAYAGAHGVLVSGDTNWLATAAPSGTPNLMMMGVG